MSKEEMMLDELRRTESDDDVAKAIEQAGDIEDFGEFIKAFKKLTETLDGLEAEMRDYINRTEAAKTEADTPEPREE